MDSRMVADIFRQLFRHRPRGCLSLQSSRQATLGSHGLRAMASQSSAYSTRTRPSRDRGMKTNESRWQQRTSILPEDRTAEFAQYPQMSLDDLKYHAEPPRRCKMLLRDFVDGTSASRLPKLERFDLC